jgi:hypothetical protein
MSNSFALEVFAEDAAHEAFLLPFVKRLAVEEGASVEVRVRSAVGGHGRALSEFDLFQKTLSQRLSATPDLVVVCIDANCKRHNQAHRDIADRVTPALCECTIIACPDPHIERCLGCWCDACHQEKEVRTGFLQGSLEEHDSSGGFIGASWWNRICVGTGATDGPFPCRQE